MKAITNQEGGTRMQKLSTVLSLICLIAFSVCPSNAQAMDWTKVAIVTGIGYDFPVRSPAFVSAADGPGFTRYVRSEYEFNPNFSMGLGAGWSDYDLNGGGEFNLRQWGPYTHFTLDLIPENHWYIWVELGGVRNETQELTGDLLAPSGDKGIELESLPLPSWELMSAMGVEFYAKGNVRARLGVHFGDMVGDEVGSMKLTAALVWVPWEMMRK